jgi:hypothetical protein
MAHWILTLMLALVPHAKYEGTFTTTAAAINRAAHEEPLYAGEDGPARTAAQLVALAWFESRFDPQAVGDHGASLGLFQIGVSNLPALGMKREDLFDPDKAAHAAIKMMRASFVMCSVRPKEERLAHYAAGGPDCARGRKESRHRTALAAALLRTHRVTWTEVASSH